jgi:AcrR family transcriptional regulator
MAEIEKIDRRKVRTRQLLRDAMMALVSERGYDNITIQDITDRANVNRSTFYLHYKDKDELLFNSMREMYDEILRVFYRDKGFPKAVSPDNIPHTEDYKHVARFADFYRVMLSEKGSAGFIIRVMEYLQTVTTQEMSKTLLDNKTQPQVPVDLVAAFCAGAQIGMIRWWLARGMPEPPEELARMQYDLYQHGVLWAMGIE